MNIALAVIVLLEFAGLIALGVLLIVSRRKLAGSRKELRRRAHESRPSRRRPIGVAPLAVNTVVNTL